MPLVVPSDSLLCYVNGQASLGMKILILQNPSNELSSTTASNSTKLEQFQKYIHTG